DSGLFTAITYRAGILAKLATTNLRKEGHMRRIASAALTVLMAFSVMLSLSSTASANALAGGGNSSSYSGESVFTNQPAGGSGQFSAIFFNDGSTTWAPGVVGLLVCDASKTTCNVASPN